jgi:hypothetical protein
MKVTPVALHSSSAPQVITPAAPIKVRTLATPDAPQPVINVEPVTPPADPIPPVDPVNSPVLDANKAQPSEETKPLSPQMAALAKQRRALQVKERELQEREKAFQASASKKDSWIDPAQLKEKPLSVLLQNGVTYNQLTEALLSGQGDVNPEIADLKASIQALQDGFTKTMAEKDAQAERQALDEMRREATFLATQGDDFEMIRETGSISDVVSLIEKTYRQSGEILDVKEAMGLVEAELVSEAMKIANIKKMQAKLQPPPPPPPPVVETPPPAEPVKQQTQAMRTIINRDSSNSNVMTAKQRAIAAFTGQLRR